VEPIRYVDSVGGYSIAYQVLGDGPLDIVFVHGWVCSFQPAWEWPALASFYRRLASMGRLILFDKRGTGLSDRVLGIASLEERMDDVRAVMDAAAVERAAVLGVSEGGPMCALFAATYPDRTLALVTMGSYARRNWAPDYPIGRRAEDDGWLRPTAEQWGAYAARRFLAQRAPSIAEDEQAVEWYASYLVRGASPSAVAAITDMNEEIDVRPVLPTVRVPSLVLYRENEYLRDASRYMGERLPGARVVAVPGVDHLPWEGDQTAVLDQIELFLGGLAATPVTPGPVLTTVLVADLPDAETRLLDSVLSRFRGHVREGRGAGLRAGFDGPARAVRCATALADHLPALRAGIHTGECELRDGMVSGSALAVATYLAGTAEDGEVLTTSTVQDLVAGSGIDFDERGSLGELRLFSVLR
jgi:pimeloyl-ACP methyl ester carboxylesterase